jgi:FSR family fosmidomycin resistance protein-like MFS transporter
MSIFTVGGTLGIGTGPLMVTPALVYLGLRGSLVLAIPAIIMCIVLFFLSSGMSSFAEATEKEEKKNKGDLKNEWLKFLWISLAITCRSIIAHGMNIFVPLYWVYVLDQSKATGGLILSFMIFTGAITTVIGGQLADRFGINRIMKIGWIILIPSIFFLTTIANPLFTLLMLVPISVGNYLVTIPLIVLGQKCLPKNVGFASGITLGLAVSIGGVFAPILGSYADVNGLTATLRLLVILPLIGTLIAFTTKEPANN